LIYKTQERIKFKISYSSINIENHDFPHLSDDNLLRNYWILSVPLGKIILTFRAFVWYNIYLNRLRIKKVMAQNITSILPQN